MRKNVYVDCRYNFFESFYPSRVFFNSLSIKNLIDLRIEKKMV